MTSFLGPFIHILQGVLSGLYSVFSSWGWAIVGLTVVLRLLLLPLAVKQQRAAQEMQALQPRLKELQGKFRKDREALQRETMALYQEAKVNPLASCLPLLVQMPVFLALYYAIKDMHALETASFLWLPALGQPDPTYVLLVIYVATQLISTQLSFTPEMPSQQRWMMRVLPLVMVAFLMHFPAGLFVYWVSSNLWTVAQQLALRHWLLPARPAAAEPAARIRHGRSTRNTAAKRKKLTSSTDAQ